MTCCAKYSSGDLREPVTFERATRAMDAHGSPVTSWAAISGAPEWAKVKPMSGRERWASSRVEATANYRVVIRYTSDLTEKDRVMIRNRPAQIRFIANVDMADEWLEIDVELGPAT